MSDLTGRPITQKGAKPGKSAPYRNAARDQSCKLEIYGVCNGDRETVVGCHLRLYNVAGTAQKPDDVLMVDACSSCHEILDNRSSWSFAGLDHETILRALMLTIQSRRAAGLIHLEDEK